MGWRTVDCPKCQAQFDHPLITKRVLGITFYPLGSMKCPNCGYEGRSLEFRRVKEGEHPHETPSRPEQLTPSEDTQAKKLEESKYEKG